MGNEAKMRILLTIFIVIGAAFAAPLNLLNAKIITPENTYMFASGKVNILMFGASWCPPCVEAKTVIDEARNQFAVNAVYVDTDKVHVADFDRFGLKSRIPLILVSDKSGMVIKRFEALPNKKIFFELIKRINEGRLENGTPPVEDRADLWKKTRFDK